MRLLLDECLPKRTKSLFAAAGHVCQTVQEAGLSGKENGELLTLAEERFDVLVTIDRNLPHQQNIQHKKISVLIIRTASNDLDDIRPHVPAALAALRTIRPGRFEAVGL
jgi:predicted nuclease of predicted toxin-antitoxin system